MFGFLSVVHIAKLSFFCKVNTKVIFYVLYNCCMSISPWVSICSITEIYVYRPQDGARCRLASLDLWPYLRWPVFLYSCAHVFGSFALYKVLKYSAEMSLNDLILLYFFMLESPIYKRESEASWNACIMPEEPKFWEKIQDSVYLFLGFF